jgi:ubiquinone biosynthesis protein UbiJ
MTNKVILDQNLNAGLRILLQERQAAEFKLTTLRGKCIATHCSVAAFEISFPVHSPALLSSLSVSSSIFIHFITSRNCPVSTPSVL